MLLGSAAEMRLWLGDYQAAEDAYGDALALASSIGDLSARPLLLAELGWVALLRGDVVTAERLSVEAAELAEDLGNRRVLAHALRLQGEALLRRGDLGASTALDGALAVAEELGAPAEVAGVRCSQACLALEEGRLDEARRLAGEAKALSALAHTDAAGFPRVGARGGGSDGGRPRCRPSGSSGWTSNPPRGDKSFATRPTVCGAWLG